MNNNFDMIPFDDEYVGDIFFPEDIYIQEKRELAIYHQGDRTVAVEYNHAFDGMELIIERYPWVDVDWLMTQKKFMGNDKLVAIVKCHKDDKPSEIVGRHEAIKKLNKAILVQREKIVEKFEEYIKNQVNNPAAKNQNYLDISTTRN